jgi:hypothetical protein
MQKREYEGQGIECRNVVFSAIQWSPSEYFNSAIQGMLIYLKRITAIRI